ncbi:MAG TPA: hypothetical protein DCL15_09800 [Chloroflexi bacterium]|nr:hypothetical protein [Chloroflexota bacterium]HHW87987.1 hypothetical protein [Chloroflexota bacterium]
MNVRTLEPLYGIAAQALTQPDYRWLETWRWRLGDIQLDLWLDNEDELLARPLLALMQSLPLNDEQRWLPRLVQEYGRLFTPRPIDVMRLPVMQDAAQQWGYGLTCPGEPGLAPALAFMAYLCRMAGEQPAANAQRHALLTEALCPLIQATAHRLQRQATIQFYQAAGAFLPALVQSDLAGNGVRSGAMLARQSAI